MSNTTPSIAESDTALLWPPVGGHGGDIALPPSEVRAGGGAKRPLDLIEGHLTDNSPLFQAGSSFRPGFSAGVLVKNWSFPTDWDGPGEDGQAQLLKIQEFEHGGYEATIRRVDLARIGRVMEFGGCRGKREEREQQHKHVMRAAGRARRKVRHLVKNMAATHLATFTRRESDPAEFWTAEDWAAAWDKLRRSTERVIGAFPYVAILERHKKGNFHLHVAWCGRINLNVIRPIWWACCGGRGEGNVDAQHIKVRSGLERSSRVASYISKYVSKMFAETGRFNKKRYWCSRQSMADVRRWVLRAGDLAGAMSEVKTMLGLDWGKFMRLNRGKLEPDHMFMFPDGGGLWFNFLPEIHAGAPPF